MRPPPHRKVALLLVICLALGLTQTRSQSNIANPVGETIQSLVSSPHFPSETEVELAIKRLLAESKKQDLAIRLVEFARLNSLDVNALYAIRMMGAHVRPEFEGEVITQIEDEDNSLPKARLLLLLRNARPPMEQSLLHHLEDKRVAETLSKRAAAEGAAPFRVCDVAFNVIQEISSSGKAISHKSPTTTRDEQIDEYMGRHSGGDKPPQPASTPKALPVVLPPTTKAPEFRPTTSTPNEESTSSMPWSIIVVLIVAAIGLLWLLLKRRS